LFVAQPRWRQAFPVVDRRPWSGFALLVFNDVCLMSLIFFLTGLLVWKSFERIKESQASCGTAFSGEAAVCRVYCPDRAADLASGMNGDCSALASSSVVGLGSAGVRLYCSGKSLLDS
jgi:hypothetical protein